MKLLKLIFTITILSVITTNAQNSAFIFSEQSFEKEVVEYNPPQRETVAKEKFDYAKMILSETKKDVEKNGNTFNILNYFNILSAFLELKEPPQNAQLAFNKFKNAEGSCEYITLFWSKVADNPKYAAIRDTFAAAEKECKSETVVDTPINLADYAKANNLNLDLVKLISEISENDAKYRSDKDIDWSKQTPLDLKNQQLIEELFKKHKTYLGTKSVGKEFENVMWSVIQHSNLQMMEKYLPIVHQAVKENELASTPLKMLLDRIYSLKFNYQIFGSQQNVKLADETTQNNVKKQYGLD